jgi:hypothetical protein
VTLKIVGACATVSGRRRPAAWREGVLFKGFARLVGSAVRSLREFAGVLE